MGPFLAPRPLTSKLSPAKAAAPTSKARYRAREQLQAQEIAGQCAAFRWA